MQGGSVAYEGRRRWQRWAGFASLVILAGASTWMARVMDRATTPPPVSSRHEPDFYMENFSSTVMGEDGRPRRRIRAEYMAHFPDTNTKELARPRILLYRARGQPWRIESERGWVSADDDVMLLLGRVRIWRENEAGAREIDIQTQDLRVLPETEYGETDRPVVIRTATSVSRGVGMRAYLSQSRLELLSKVHTRYAKQQP